MEVARGHYLPDGVTPTKGLPVYITEQPVMGGHIALTIEIKTLTPDVKSDLQKYNVRSATDKDWRGGTKIREGAQSTLNSYVV